MEDHGPLPRWYNDPEVVNARQTFNARNQPEGGWASIPRCFSCGGDSFGPHPQNPALWTCGSPDHKKPGLFRNGGWVGDALDFASFNGGKSPIAVLKTTVVDDEPLLDKDFMPLDYEGVDPDSFVYHAPDAKWYLRNPLDPRKIEDVGFTADALYQMLQSKRLNKRSIKDLKIQIPVIVKEDMFFDTDQVLVEIDGWKNLNTYRRPVLKPEEGDWTPIRNVLLNLVNNDEPSLEFVLDWLTRIIKPVYNGKPPTRLGTALVFYGREKGAGKNTFQLVLESLLGSWNVFPVGQEDLEAKHNGFIDSKLLLIANEVYSSDNRSAAVTNKLKNWITEDEITVEYKYRNRKKVTSHFSMIFFSNDLRPVTVEWGDRRFSTFKVGGKIPVELGAQVGNDARVGGPLVRAFLSFLLKREPQTAKPFTVFANEVKSGLEYLGLNSAEKFAAEIRETGLTEVARPWLETDPGLRPGLREEDRKRTRAVFVANDFVRRKDLMEIYTSWAQHNGLGKMASPTVYAYLRDTFREKVVEKSRRISGGPLAGVHRGWEGFAQYEPSGSPEITLNSKPDAASTLESRIDSPDTSPEGRAALEKALKTVQERRAATDA